MSTNLFIFAGLLLAGVSCSLGLVLTCVWPDTDKRKAQRILTALWYMGIAQLGVGVALTVARAGGAA